jgi:16S rRNA (guanine(966)-N(2))-methyltransferase RsmD
LSPDKILLVRIIAGTLKGRRLLTPDFEGLRPTSDKLRETLFNVIAQRVPKAKILDAFAGTGAIGIEALSRGAAHVTFVDEDPRAVTLIRENLRRCGVVDGASVVEARFTDVSARLAGAPFDVIVLDPPYNEAAFPEVIQAAAAIVAAGGLVVLEHARRSAVPLLAGILASVRTLVSGDSALTFYQRQPSCEERPATHGR